MLIGRQAYIWSYSKHIWRHLTHAKKILEIWTQGGFLSNVFHGIKYQGPNTLMNVLDEKTLHNKICLSHIT